MSITLLANAKINPTLRVLGRRGDGFHEVVTTMLALDLGDVVSASTPDVEGVEVSMGGALASPDIPTDATNLAVRGALLGREAAGSESGLSLSVVKNIPSRAGLGGGSADAAAAARAVVVELGAEDACLDGRLGALGSDCAFFQGARRTGAALALATADVREGTRAGGRARAPALVRAARVRIRGALPARRQRLQLLRPLRGRGLRAGEP